MARMKTPSPSVADAPRSSKAAGFRLPRTSTLPLYLQITEAIRGAITEGRLVAGQRLPAIRHICDELGVSYVTVARGINALVQEGVLDASTADGTRVAVRRRARLQTIGLVGVDPYQHIIQRSRYYTAMLTELLHNVVQHSRTVVYAQWSEDKPLAEMFDNLSLVDGLILLGPDQDHLKQIRAAQRMGVPVVIVGKTYDQDVPTVDSANIDDTFRATRTLLDMGHERIACLGPESAPNAIPGCLRHEGYRRAMQQSPAGFDERAIISAKPRNLASPLLALDPSPTAAIVIGETAFMNELTQRLKGTHLDIDKALFLCVYDDDLWNVVAPLGIDYMRIEQSIGEIAKAAVDLIVRMLDDHDFHPAHIGLPSTLVRIKSDGSRQVL